MVATSPIVIAERYAQALLAVVGTGEAADRALDELTGVATALADRMAVLRLGSMDAAAASRLSARLCAAGVLSDPVRRVLGVLARRGRLALCRVLAEQFAQLLNGARKRVSIDVATRAPLTQAHREQLTHMLLKLTHAREILLQERIEPSLLGGFKACGAGFVLDASLQRRLQRAETAMKGTG